MPPPRMYKILHPTPPLLLSFSHMPPPPLQVIIAQSLKRVLHNQTYYDFWTHEMLPVTLKWLSIISSDLLAWTGFSMKKTQLVGSLCSSERWKWKWIRVNHKISLCFKEIQTLFRLFKLYFFAFITFWLFFLLFRWDILWLNWKHSSGHAPENNAHQLKYFSVY